MAFEVKHVAIWRALASGDTNNSWLQLVAANVPSTSESNQTVALLAGTALANNVPLVMPMFDSVRYVIAAGASFTGQILITFQELGLDGVWRNLQNPAPVTVPQIASTAAIINGVIDGPLPGIRIFLQNIASGNINYAALYGTIRSNL